LLKLLFLLLVPGFFAEFIVKDNRIKHGNSFGKRAMNGLLYSYFLFLLDLSFLVIFYTDQYAHLLDFFSRRLQTVEDLSLFTVLLLVQLLFAYAMAVTIRIIKSKGIERAFYTMTLVQKEYTAGIIFLSVIAALITFVAKDNAEQSVVINEVCSKNDSVIKDDNGNCSDYIELYNPSKWSVSLKGFRISDQADVKNGMELRDGVVPAGGYYIVWLDESAGTTSFRISSKGESIYLFNESGMIMDTVTVPELHRNTSYARATDGDDEWQQEEATPGFANNPLKKHLDAPVFSAESGFYEEEFLLSIQAGEGQKIYYTLDSSTPDENASLYTDEILVKNVCDEPNVHIIRRNVVEHWWDDYNPEYGVVDKVFVVRAVAMDDLGNTSDVVTKVYLVDMEEYKDRNVLSLVSDPDNLFGDDGIYVTGKEYDEWYKGDRTQEKPVANFLKKGREYEIPGALTFINNDVLWEQNVGLRIQGGSARKNALKRFSIFARDEYSGSRYFDYDLFGRDTHSMFTRGELADSLTHSVAMDRNIGTLKAIPVVTFLDGEWWYDTYLREKYNEDYMSVVYGVPKDKIEILESIPLVLKNFIEEHDLSKEEDYKEFCELVDVQSYIDYMTVNLYACNMDFSEYWNYKIWRTTEKTDDFYGDGRYRWLLYDVDCFGWYGAECYKIDSFAEAGKFSGVAMNQHMVYRALKSNEDFCRRFVLSFMDIVNHNFAYDRVAEHSAELGYDISIFSGFFENRSDVIVPALAREFELQGTLEEITLAVNDETAGYVQMNTITPDLTNGSWTGKYYTDYPVTITAVPNDGYEFVGWKCGDEIIKNTQIEVQLTEGGCLWEAVFE